MRVDDYISRGIIPDWPELPSERHYRVILGVSRHAKGEDQVINVMDAEECVDAGWLKTLPSGSWVLTASGRRFL